MRANQFYNQWLDLLNIYSYFKGTELFEERLIEILQNKGVSKQKIDDVIDSGYIIRKFGDPSTGKTWESISDKMFGNKGWSSSFEIEKFIKYILGEYNFPSLPKFVEYTVKNIDEINEILSSKARQNYIREGRITFRGQTSQHTYTRKIPNPVRADNEGNEISIFPGVFRQNKDKPYSFNTTYNENRTLKHLYHKLEPNNPDIQIDSSYAYDTMRIEQHYATQTSGLDVSFDIETAIFFATYQFKSNSKTKNASYEKIKTGYHNGVIYGFCFTNPPVKKSEFLIEEFDLFKTYRPERIIRQNCGLPLFGEYERNIAITDLDFIIHLHRDFDYNGTKTPEYMFPNTKEDTFYGKLLELKDLYPDLLKDIVEYTGSRA